MTIRQLEKRDLYKVAELRNKHIKYLRQNKWLTLNDQEKWFENTKDQYFIIEEPDVMFAELSNRTCGVVGLTQVDWISRKAELSLITENYIIESYATAAMEFILDYGFNQLNLHKIFFTVYEFDDRKIKLIENHGMRADAIIRDEYYYNGQYYSLLIYSILDNEWREK